jgi:hypothetical protein
LTRLSPIILAATCSTLLACTGAADIPSTPDLSRIQAQFKYPTATLDVTAAAQTLGIMPSLQEIAAAFRAAGYVKNGVTQASTEVEQSSASRFNVQGSLNVTVRCPGDAASPTYGSNGTLALTIAVEKNLIKHSIGGEASHCVLRGDIAGRAFRVEVDGPLAFDFGRDLGLRTRLPDQLLMNIRGSLDIEGYQVQNLSARWTEERLEYLVILGNGDWIVAVVEGDGTVSIRDKDSTWGCSDGQTCSKL